MTEYKYLSTTLSKNSFTCYLSTADKALQSVANSIKVKANSGMIYKFACEITNQNGEVMFNSGNMVKCYDAIKDLQKQTNICTNNWEVTFNEESFRGSATTTNDKLIGTAELLKEFGSSPLISGMEHHKFLIDPSAEVNKLGDIHHHNEL